MDDQGYISRPELEGRIRDSLLKRNVVFVSGPAGIGKSTLVDRVATRLLQEGIFDHALKIDALPPEFDGRVLFIVDNAESLGPDVAQALSDPSLRLILIGCNAEPFLGCEIDVIPVDGLSIDDSKTLFESILDRAPQHVYLTDRQLTEIVESFEGNPQAIHLAATTIGRK